MAALLNNNSDNEVSLKTSQNQKKAIVVNFLGKCFTENWASRQKQKKYRDFSDSAESCLKVVKSHLLNGFFKYILPFAIISITCVLILLSALKLKWGFTMTGANIILVCCLGIIVTKILCESLSVFGLGSIPPNKEIARHWSPCREKLFRNGIIDELINKELTKEALTTFFDRKLRDCQDEINLAGNSFFRKRWMKKFDVLHEIASCLGCNVGSKESYNNLTVVN